MFNNQNSILYFIFFLIWILFGNPDDKKKIEENAEAGWTSAAPTALVDTIEARD